MLDEQTTQNVSPHVRVNTHWPDSMYTDNLQRTLLRLDTLTNWEHRARCAMRTSLGPIRDLVERLGNPQSGFRTIHVTGTKGKGSVCALLESALLKAGLTVGRYASPHLERINERASMAGKSIDDQTLSDCLMLALDAHEAARREGSPAGHATWFDVLTAAAFLAFRDARLSWVIVEVGLGGANDSTNVLDSEIAVVTNVELEHTEVLGKTRSAIALEKVGILKPGTCLVTTLPSTDEAGKILHDRAEALRCSLNQVSIRPGERLEESNVRIAGAVLDYLGEKERQPLHAKVIGAHLIDRHVRAAARLPGRLERFYVRRSDGAELIVVMDGAHVPFNLEAVLRELTEEADLKGPCVAVVGIGSDKDARGMLSVLSHYVADCVFTDLPAPSRGIPSDDLGQRAHSIGIASEARCAVSSAVERAIELASKNSGWVLITGSLHLVGAARKLAPFRQLSGWMPASPVR